MTATILANALDDVAEYFERLPDLAETAGAFAINEVSSKQGLAVLRDSMEKQINFPQGYLNKQRLSVTQRATAKKLEAKIQGRDRATSLARFVEGAREIRGKKGLRVRVKPGVTQELKNAFLLKLRNGNIGLAVRLKDGERMANSSKAVRLENNLYLLYGPSVDQVLKDTAVQEAPVISGLVSKEFKRQFERLARG